MGAAGHAGIPLAPVIDPQTLPTTPWQGLRGDVELIVENTRHEQRLLSALSGVLGRIIREQAEENRAVHCGEWRVLDSLVDVTEIDPRLDRTSRRRSSAGVRWIILVVAGLVPAFFLSMLLALNIDEYQSYSAAIGEYGDGAALNADEAEFGIQIFSLLLATLWLFVTGIAAAMAAATRLPVIRTTAFIGGGLALFVGLLLFLGLKFGTV